MDQRRVLFLCFFFLNERYYICIFVRNDPGEGYMDEM